MAEDICQWLEELELGKYSDVFVDNEITLQEVGDLNDSDLKELGLPMGPRKRFLRAISDRLAQATDPENMELQSKVQNKAPTTERRQVTILFADIVGYTKMSSEVDAEEVHKILGTYFDTVDAIVRQYGGTVDKHVGDSVMAIFGAPVAHSDDPTRAVRAALAIHAAMPEISVQADRELHVHIGIASGQVVASGVGSDTHYTVTGDSVNLASRLTDAAEAGETLISQRVQRVLSTGFEFIDRGAFSVKGITEPVQTYSLQGIGNVTKSRQNRSFFGRQAELQQLSGILKACAEVGAGQVVYLRGEAGIGKTRLTEEFEQIALDTGFTCHRALILDFGVGKDQDAISTLVRSFLSIPPEGDTEERIKAVSENCNDGPLDSGHRVYLNDILDIPQPLELRTLYDAMDNEKRIQGKRDTVSALINGLSAACPLFLLVEDIHWADEPVLQYLMEIARNAVDHPIILVMTSRIEGDPLDQNWRSLTAATPLATIDLRPLRHEDAIAFAADYIDATSAFAQSCIKRADGNPLFLEQLLRSAEEVGDDQVPGSVQSIVQARLDSLESLDKQAIQTASVLGQRFSLGALRHLLNNPNYSCESLIEHFLIRPEGNDYLFSHALVREAVYNSLLKAHQAKYHRTAAAWYGEKDPVLCAKHLDRSNDPGAATAYLKAAEIHAADLRFDSAFELANRGIELVEDSDTKCDLLCLRGDILRNLGETDKSITTFEASLKHAEDDLRQCRSWIGLAEGLRVTDKQNAALEALEKAETAATKNKFLSQCAHIHYLRGNVYFPMGNIDGCLEEHEKSLGFAREIGSAEGEALALGGLGDAYYLRGHMRSACEQFQACINVCQERGYGRIEVANRSMVGWSRIHLMEFSQARDDGLATAKLAREVNHHRAETLGLNLAGLVELEMGNFAKARDYVLRGKEFSRMMGAKNFLTQSCLMLARLCAAESQIGEARKYIGEAESLINEVGMTFIGPTVLAVKASLTDDAGERKDALAVAESVLDSGCVAHNHMWFSRTAIDLSIKLEDWNEVDRYATRLEASTTEQPLASPEFMIARGRALAAWGRGERNDGLFGKITRLRDLANQTGLKLALPELERALTAG